MKEGNNFTLSLFLQTSWNVVVLGLYIVHQCSVATVHDLYIKKPTEVTCKHDISCYFSKTNEKHRMETIGFHGAVSRQTFLSIKN